ncbi:type II toxin-antitoxin system RelE/ParE family toxin [Alteromonas oceani]|uniref:Type II toxin-antitoxin system RelE/ParE family toxin n=1 Tax=Alteromonas oceani TaxID=2071609 RepID=A0ABV7K227_9ALTE|nr:type II toxin-antitoxin system RelE/ParE family toxin [Alteromonas oceani]
MASYKLSELAEDDLRLIAIKTIEAWGHSQAEAYILLLHEALIKIANAPDIGKRRPELSDNARSFPIQKHMVITGPQHRASKSPEYYINEWMIYLRLNRK